MQPTLGDGELILRLALSILLCGAIGMEREARGQVAGLRTHILVGLGATLFTLVSAYGFSDFVRPAPPGTSSGPVTAVDPTRIAAQIVTGIGFLGAGAIIRQGLSVRGLTTAAALWIVAAVGMAVGAGYYLAATGATVGVLVALIGFRKARPWMMAPMQSHVAFVNVTMAAHGNLGDVLDRLSRSGAEIESMDSHHEADRHSYRLEIRVPTSVDLEQVSDEVGRLDAVEEIGVQGHRAE